MHAHSQSAKVGAMPLITKRAQEGGQMSTRRLWISAGRLSARMWRLRRSEIWKTGEEENIDHIGGIGEEGRWRDNITVRSCEGEHEAAMWGVGGGFIEGEFTYTAVTEG